MAKEPSLPYYLLIIEGENRWIHVFLKGISMKWNAKYQLGKKIFLKICAFSNKLLK